MLDPSEQPFEAAVEAVCGRLSEVHESLAMSDGHRVHVMDVTDDRQVAALGKELLESGTAVDIRVQARRNLRVQAIPDNLAGRSRPLLGGQGTGAVRGHSGIVAGHVEAIVADLCVLGLRDIGMAGHAACGMTKSALDGLTRTLAVELAPRGIRVNAVAPGCTAKPMNKRFRSDRTIVAQREYATLAGRLGEPDDIARAILFLASDASSFVHGVPFPVDGGYPTSPVQFAALATEPSGA